MSDLSSSRSPLVAHPASYRTASFIEAGERLGVRTVVASNSRLGLSPTGRPGVEIDFSDPQTAVERIRQFHARDPINAVLGVEDASLEIAASVALALSLRSNEPQAIRDARLKHLCRRILATAGLLSPTYRVLEPEETMSSEGVREFGFPCVVKPVMSSSGKGQSLLRSDADLQKSWDYAQEGGGAGKGRVIIEGFIDFEYEITLLTVRHVGGTTFLEPVGHRQEKGDYQESRDRSPH